MRMALYSYAELYAMHTANNKKTAARIPAVTFSNSNKIRQASPCR